MFSDFSSLFGFPAVPDSPLLALNLYIMKRQRGVQDFFPIVPSKRNKLIGDPGHPAASLNPGEPSTATSSTSASLLAPAEFPHGEEPSIATSSAALNSCQPSTGASSTSLPHSNPVASIDADYPYSSEKVDIGLYEEMKIDDSLRYKLLTNCWIPDESYIFPVSQEGKSTRRFKRSYLHTFKPWLYWSHGKQGVYCLYCVLFASEMTGKGGNQAPGALVKKPLTKMKDIISDCQNHASTKYHAQSMNFAEGFMKRIEGKTVDVISQMDSTWKKQVAENRKRLVPIIETVHLCGKQGLALRGHRDHGPIAIQDDPGFNDGNFRACLRYRAQGGDETLKWHLSTCSKNASFISWNIQNQIIDATAEIMRAECVKNINAAPFFTVISDATTDNSVKEQLSTVIRFVKDSQIHETFLGFEELTSSTGEGIGEKLLHSLQEYGLDLKKMRGQAYDGCSAMKGENKGAQAFIQSRYPKALYMHCSNHVLNLVASDSAKQQDIRNCIGTVKEVIAFLRGSAKRMHLFKEKLQGFSEDFAKRTLSSFSETRFVEKHEKIVRFKEMFPAIVTTLEDIENWTDTIAATKATQYSAALFNHRFLVALCVCSRFSAILLPISKNLQDPEVDLLECVEQVNDIRALLQECRTKGEQEFRDIFLQAEKIAQGPITIPRKCQTQTQRANFATGNPEEYFRQSIFIPYLDGLIMQLTERFSSHVQRAMKLQRLIPSHLQGQAAAAEELSAIFEDFKDDLDCSAQEFIDEFERWKIKWSKYPLNERPRNAIATLQAQFLPFYPNITKLLVLFATLPISTASAERSFSCMKLLKTYIRSTMGQERLSGLAMMQIHREKVPQPCAVIDKLAASKRRLELLL